MKYCEQSTDELSRKSLENILLRKALKAAWKEHKEQQDKIHQILLSSEPEESDENIQL